MFKSCTQCNLPTKEFFLRGARLAFGIWLLYVGLDKWMGGASNFVGYITSEFANTWSPKELNTILAWVILIAEPAIGLWLIIGKCQRMAWAAAAKLMFLLMFGLTILHKPDTVHNFEFFVFCLTCAALAPAPADECKAG